MKIGNYVYQWHLNVFKTWIQTFELSQKQCWKDRNHFFLKHLVENIQSLLKAYFQFDNDQSMNSYISHNSNNQVTYLLTH